MAGARSLSIVRRLFAVRGLAAGPANSSSDSVGFPHGRPECSGKLLFRKTAIDDRPGIARNFLLFACSLQRTAVEQKNDANFAKVSRSQLELFKSLHVLSLSPVLAVSSGNRAGHGDR